MASTSLSRTFGTPTSDKKFTLSLWLKRSNVTTDNSFFSTYTDVNNRADIRFNASEQLSFYEAIGGVTQYYVVTDRLFRDCSAYYSIVIAFDTTQAVDTNRLKLYVNGVQETSFSSTSFPALNQSLRLTSAVAHSIGNDSNSAYYFDGLMSNIVFVDGLAYAPTEFGAVDSTSGIWKFKPPSGLTYGTNGFWLKGENSGALGTDSSGNTNTFTTAGSPTQAIDTPSNVLATFNSIDNYWAGSTFSYGNTKVVTSSLSYAANLSTLGVSTGKFYAEFKCTDEGRGYPQVGIKGNSPTAASDGVSNGADSVCYYGFNGEKLVGGSSSPYGTTYGTGDIIGVAMDLTNNRIFFSKNNVWQDSGDPTSSTGAITIPTSTSGFYFMGVDDEDNAGTNTWEANFGNGYFGITQVSSAGTSSTDDDSIWEYDCPTGYYGLNTKNINTYG